METVKSATILNKIVEYAIYGLAFIIPFSKAGIEIFGVIAIVAWLTKIISGLLVNKAQRQSLQVGKPILLSLSLFLFASLLSCITSVSFLHSVKSLLTKTVEYSLFFLIVVDTFSNQKKIRILLKVLLVSFSFVCIDAAIQYFTGADIVRKYPLHLGYMLTGPFLHHNDFANYLITFIPLLLMLFIYKKSILKYRVLNFFIFLMALAALMHSYVRASWLAFLISISFLTFCINKKAFICFMSILIISSFFLPAKVMDRIKEINDMNDLLNEYRVGIWQEALKMIKERPLLGWGVNSYATVAPGYKIHPRGGIYPHNSYLHMAAEIGMIGLVAFLWFLFTILKRATVYIKQSKDELYQVIPLGLMAGFVAFLCNAFFDTSLYALKIATTFWVMAGILVASCNVAEEGLPKKA